MRLYSVIEGLRRAATNDHPWIATPAEAGVLVAEMERLRAESATFRRLLAEAVQTSADLCPECGWRFLVPDNGCQKCELDRFRAQRAIGNEALARAWDEGGAMERAAVVAYLRAGTAECRYCLDAAVIGFAGRVERGEHREEKP
jgi:hypothetical protein